jgi:hypothetical protein
LQFCVVALSTHVDDTATAAVAADSAATTVRDPLSTRIRYTLNAGSVFSAILLYLKQVWRGEKIEENFLKRNMG